MILKRDDIIRLIVLIKPMTVVFSLAQDCLCGTTDGLADFEGIGRWNGCKNEMLSRDL